MVSSNPNRDADIAEPGSPGRQGSSATSAEAFPDLTRQLDLEDCREELHRLQSALKQLRSENLALNRELGQSDVPKDLQVLIEDQARRLDLMRASLSWRITAPLRQLARMFGAD